MQPQIDKKLSSTGIKTFSRALIFSCLLCTKVGAADLGKLTVLSSQGQPLKAEIELTLVPNEDVGKLVPRLASSEVFHHANIDFDSRLLALNFAVADRGARQVILINSTQPINEPLLKMVLELNSGSGQSVQEYTITFNPVENQANVSSEIDTAKQDAAENQILHIDSSSVMPIASYDEASTKVIVNDVEISSDVNNGSAYYQIRKGDTLKKIAAQFKSTDVSLEQMLVALQRSNSFAFIKGNMNLIRSGEILAIPDLSEIKRIAPSEAQKIVLAQSDDFNAYRSKLANQVEQDEPGILAGSKKTNSGKIKAKVIEAATPANQSTDKLKLSNAQLKEQTDITAFEEDEIAQQRAFDAVHTRFEELEQNIAKLQTVLEQEKKSSASVVPAVLINSKIAGTPILTSLPAYLAYMAACLTLLSAGGLYLIKRKKSMPSINQSVETKEKETESEMGSILSEGLKPPNFDQATTTHYSFDLSGIDFELPKASFKESSDNANIVKSN